MFELLKLLPYCYFQFKVSANSASVLIEDFEKRKRKMNLTTASPHYSVRMFLAYTGITFIASLVIFRILAPRLSAYFIPGYRHFSQEDKIRWNCAVVSQCFAMSISCVAVYGFLLRDEMHLDPVWGTSSAVPMAFGLAVGYLIEDTIIMLLEPSAHYELQYMCHHIVALVGVISVAVTGSCAFFAFHRFLHELSNIFLNFMRFFNNLRVEKKSPLYLANGLLFTVMFFFCRIAIMPWFWKQFFYCSWSDIVKPPLFVFYAVGAVGLALDIMNFYWFHLIVKGLLKVLRGEGSSKDKSKTT